MLYLFKCVIVVYSVCVWLCIYCIPIKCKKNSHLKINVWFSMYVRRIFSPKQLCDFLYNLFCYFNLHFYHWVREKIRIKGWKTEWWTRERVNALAEEGKWEDEDKSAEGRQRGGKASERLRAERGACLIAWEGVCGGVTCFFSQGNSVDKKNLEDEERTVLTRWTTHSDS